MHDPSSSCRNFRTASHCASPHRVPVLTACPPKTSGTPTTSGTGQPQHPSPRARPPGTPLPPSRASVLRQVGPGPGPVGPSPSPEAGPTGSTRVRTDNGGGSGRGSQAALPPGPDRCGRASDARHPPGNLPSTLTGWLGVFSQEVGVTYLVPPDGTDREGWGAR